LAAHFASVKAHYAIPANTSWSFPGFKCPLHSATVGIQTVIYLSAFSLPPDAPFAATASPSLPNRTLLRGCAAVVKKLSSNANKAAAQSSQSSLHFS
jgi:hypothetical protein